MDAHCEKCHTKYQLDDARVTESGVRMRCTRCEHVFTVRKAVAVRSSNSPRAPLVPPAVESAEAPAAPSVGDDREWKIRHASGIIVNFRELRTLHKWILERRVTREDEISLTGKTWNKLGQIKELASFFMLVAEAQGPKQAPLQASTSGIPTIAAIPSVAPLRPASPPASVAPPIAAIPSVPAMRIAAPPVPAAPFNGVANGVANGVVRGAIPAIPAIAPMRVPPPPAPRAPEPPRPAPPPPVTRSQPISETTPELHLDEPSELELGEPSEGDEQVAEQPPPPRRKPRRRRGVLFAGTAVAATAALVYGYVYYVRKPGLVAAAEGGAPVAKIAAPQAKPAEPSAVLVAAAPSGAGSAPAIVNAPASDKAAPSTAAEASPSAKESGTAVAEAPTVEKESDATTTAAEAPVSDTSGPAIAEPAVKDEGTASAGDADKPTEGVRRAKKESRKGKSSARRAEASGPKDFDWYMAEGDKLRYRQRPNAAIDAYTAAAAREPTRVDPIAGKGFAYLDLGRTQQAEAAFREALRLNPRYAVAVIGLAETYRRMGKNAQAIDQYQRYLEILPSGSQARVARTAIAQLKQ